MSEKAIRKASANIVVIFGSDKELVDFKSERLVENNRRLGLQPKIFRLSESRVDEVISEYEQGSLFSSSEFIWVKEAEHLEDNDFSKLISSLSVNRNRYMVISACEADYKKGRSRLTRWKDFEKYEHILVFAIEGSALANYVKEIVRYVRNSGFEISFKAAETLINKCNGKFSTAVSELKKLMLYKYDSRRIEEKDILSFIEVLPELKVFDFVNKVLNRDFADALKTYSIVLEGGEKPEALFYMLLNQMSQFVSAAVYIKSGKKSRRDIAEAVGINEWQVERFERFASKWKWAELVDAYWELLLLDGKLKSGEIRDYSLAVKMFAARMLSDLKAS
jgi:DNA polymerase III delta subunit